MDGLLEERIRLAIERSADLCARTGALLAQARQLRHELRNTRNVIGLQRFRRELHRSR